MEIRNISLSDFRIKEISFGEDYDEMEIISEGSVRLSDLKIFKETRIIIKKWAELNVRKYRKHGKSDIGENFEIDWADNFESFEFIQEIIIKNGSTLLLNGFSKDSGAWMTYEFKNYEYEIRI